jgi:glycosyltransferase involved in cell wall biosynthesis
VCFALEEQAEPLRADARASDFVVLPLGDPDPRRGALLHVHLSDTFDRRATAVMRRHHRTGPVVATEHLPRTNASDRSLLPDDPRTPGAGLVKASLKRRQYAAADVVIAVSSSSAAFIRRAWRVGEDKLAVVPNGLDASRYPVLPPAVDGDLHVVTIGTLSIQKGHDLLIEAMRRSRSQWRASLIGEGHHRAAYEELATRPPPVAATFTGWQPDPAAVVATASLVCVPSRWESFCYVAVEAGLWGRPVLATAVDGPDEIVLPGETGLLVPPEDPGALASALDELASDPVRMRDMAARARAHVSAMYTVDRMVERTADAYRRALAAHG